MLAFVVFLGGTVAALSAMGQEENPLSGVPDAKVEEYRNCATDASEVIAEGEAKVVNAYFFLALSECKRTLVDELWASGYVDPELRHPVLGNTLHRIAEREAGAPLVEELIEGGAKLEATNRRGLTPVVVAIRNNNRAATRKLVNAGASLQVDVPPFENVQEYCADLLANMEQWQSCETLQR